MVLRKCKYAFLTLQNYSLIAVANAIEPLRMANRLVGKEVYDWSVISLDGRAVDSSSGLALTPARALDKLGTVDILFVCGGVNVREAVSPALLAALRRLPQAKIVVTHDSPFACAMATRAVFFERGRIVAEGTPHDLVTRFRWDPRG